MRESYGVIPLYCLLEVINSLREPVRAEVVAALREHDSGTRYFTQVSGRVEAERV